MPSHAEIRTSLVSALHADLVGPFDPSASEERLTLAPSRWYLTGFLAPQGDRDPHDPTVDDEVRGAEEDDDEDTPTLEPEPKQKNHFPASLGMSVLLPPARAGETETIRATVTFADYLRHEEDVPNSRKKNVTWRRVQHPPFVVELALDAKSIEKGKFLEGTIGVVVCGKLEAAEAPGLEAGSRALSLFVVNRRPPGEPKHKDEAYLFQVAMELEYARGFAPRPNRAGEHAKDHDDRTADLQFREHCEWAVGHNVSIEEPDRARPVTRIRTTWIPTCEVRRVETRDDKDVTTSMEKLAQLTDGDAVRAALGPLVEKYGQWIEQQATLPLDSNPREQIRESLLKRARLAKNRIASGIDLLATDAEALDAFRMMNRAMATAALQRSGDRYNETTRPSWRLFQLAFVLLSLVGIANETHVDRREVELIYFPTGGGKTEAYLGVIGFTLLLRRIRGTRRPDGGLGVAVLLRYTLRLLTLDQLGRAATLICALEMLRREQPAKLGEVRFSVGLWVGRSATANTLDQVKKAILEYKANTAKNPSSPFPLTNCPWCGRALGRDSLSLRPGPSSPEEVLVHCATPQGEAPSTCDFAPRNNVDGIPVVFVDEQIYRELPSFLVATVDKFAMLPWRGETGMLFGRVSARDGRKFYGPLDREPKSATRIAGGLRPPELIVQDELHLISGPLGTMVGLYETAIEHLSSREVNGTTVRPKVIASTATVRRAREQIRALFGRGTMSLFPPPGVDASETFFAYLDKQKAGRLYVGVAAPGRALKAILLRTYVALLAGAQKNWEPQGGAQQAGDPYMTLAGYFNSLRELGGMRRLVEDDVRTRAASVEKRVAAGHVGAHPWGRDRTVAMPVELTSREKAGAIKEAKDRLGKSHSAPEHVDVLLASNMISVGVDIDRLGLMVVAGQPKTTSEYIQASSRVGRKYPGVVVTCFNVRKPRDRSHYERFVAYHQSFYRYVEATSLTPFSGPAIERGLAGTLVAMARLGDAKMTPATAAMEIAQYRAVAESCVKEMAERAARHLSFDDVTESERVRDAVLDRGMKLLDAWEKLVKEAREGATKRSYSPYDRDKTAGKALLHSPIDEGAPPEHSLDSRFAAPTSMRDVEEATHLWIERRALGGKR